MSTRTQLAVGTNVIAHLQFAGTVTYSIAQAVKGVKNEGAAPIEPLLDGGDLGGTGGKMDEECTHSEYR
jgi:hypothetical protein